VVVHRFDLKIRFKLEKETSAGNAVAAKKQMARMPPDMATCWRTIRLTNARKTLAVAWVPYKRAEIAELEGKISFFKALFAQCRCFYDRICTMQGAAGVRRNCAPPKVILSANSAVQ